MSEDNQQFTPADKEHLQRVLRHISHVRDFCELLGMRLIERGDHFLGVEVVKRGLVHDNTKLYGVEFEFLRPDKMKSHPDLFNMALKNHWSNWDHHPEHFGENGITQLSDAALCEMVCDWAARSSELGTDIREWVANEATKKYGFTMKQKIGRSITTYLNLLFDGNM